MEFIKLFNFKDFGDLAEFAKAAGILGAENLGKFWLSARAIVNYDTADLASFVKAFGFEHDDLIKFIRVSTYPVPINLGRFAKAYGIKSGIELVEFAKACELDYKDLASFTSGYEIKTTRELVEFVNKYEIKNNNLSDFIRSYGNSDINDLIELAKDNITGVENLINFMKSSGSTDGVFLARFAKAYGIKDNDLHTFIRAFNNLVGDGIELGAFARAYGVKGAENLGEFAKIHGIKTINSLSMFARFNSINGVEDLGKFAKAAGIDADEFLIDQRLRYS